VQTVNPWIGVVIIVISIASAIALTKLGVPQAGIPAALIGIAASVLNAQSHSEARKELVRAKAQLAIFKGPEISEKEES